MDSSLHLAPTFMTQLLFAFQSVANGLLLFWVGQQMISQVDSLSSSHHLNYSCLTECQRQSRLTIYTRTTILICPAFPVRQGVLDVLDLVRWCRLLPVLSRVVCPFNSELHDGHAIIHMLFLCAVSFPSLFHSVDLFCFRIQPLCICWTILCY